jgi:TRAP-type C4-dicarboxylate transport system permease small subunit
MPFSEQTTLGEAPGRSWPLLRAAYTWLLRICDYLVAFILAAELVLISYNVTARLFNSSSGWIDEVAQYSLLWLVTLGTVVLMDRYALFYTEVLLLFVENPAVRRAIFIINSLAMLVFFAFVLWSGIDYVRMTWSFEMDYSDMHKFWFYLAMPVWGGLMFIVVLKKLLCMEEPEVTPVDAEDL